MREGTSAAPAGQEVELAQARQDLESERNRISSLERDLEQTKQGLESEKDRFSSLELELAQSRADFDIEKNRASSFEQTLTRIKEGHQTRSSSLERELGEMETATQGLQRELSTTQQEVQEAMDLCSQQEALLEERNAELTALEEKLR